jgi:hypothetical protein
MEAGSSTSVISYTHHVVTQQFRFVRCGCQQCLQSVASIDNAYWPPFAVEDRKVSQAVLFHLGPYIDYEVPWAAGDHLFGHGRYDTNSTFGSATMRNPSNDIGLRYHADGFAIRFTNDDELDM